ncbi:hypothetical protein P3H15_32150 [Rhodococcus sp. T2V]|uniref:DUF4286 family protein n=1 Tax=Rhodococcus sp. T2V TaxID=3034164 RepID=UPI0023E2973A|nr:DUF4286 family protein [Rhodococcus sp. T2V]MDF3309672.1 hypothetical protein [Rhodococcus sp. T2V]
MPKAELMVFSSPVSPEREADFNQWYDEVHTPDVLAVPGVIAASRLVASDVQPTPEPCPGGHRHLVIYTIEAPDPQAVLAEILRRGRGGEWDMGDALDLVERQPISVLYETNSRRQIGAP